MTDLPPVPDPGPPPPVPVADDVPAPRWGAGHILVAFLVAQVLGAVGFVVYDAVSDVDLSAPGASDDLSIGTTMLLQIPLWVGLIGGPLLITARWGHGVVADLAARYRWRDAPKGIALGVLCQFTLVPLVSLPFLVLFDIDAEELEEPARELSDRAHGAGVLLLVLGVVVIAPLAEELFYRGLVLRWAWSRLGSAAAVAVSAVFFGISHFQVIQLPALVAFGVVLGIVTIRTRTLSLATWTHLGFNATTVLLLISDR